MDEQLAVPAGPVGPAGPARRPEPEAPEAAGAAPAEPAAQAAWPGRCHRSVRPGFHWQPAGAWSANAVYAPRSWDAPNDAEEGFARADDPRLVAVVRRSGRDGRTPVEHLDVVLGLDLLPARHDAQHDAQHGSHHGWLHDARRGPQFGLPSGELLVSAAADGDAVVLHGCTVQGGGLRSAEAGDGVRRIAWEPGTTVLVEDLPSTSLEQLPATAYTVVRGSGDDPADALRREAFALLGARYHGDIPPPPGDAHPAVSVPGEGSGHVHVPTEYPGSAGSAEVFVDRAGETLVVRRFGFGGNGTEYALPLTPERAELLTRMRHEYLYSLIAYASVGAGRDAAVTLADTPWTPAALRRLLPVMRVATAGDAACLLARSPERWDEDGWPVDLAERAGDPLRNAEPDRSWRVSQAVALAAHGISAERAYELRSSGAVSVEAAVAAHATRPTAASRTARDLVAASESPVPDAIAAELGTALAHRAERLEAWDCDHRQSCGPEGWGLWASLTRHTFTLREGSVRTLWEVGNGWWAISDEGDEGRTSHLLTDEAEARDLWHATRSDLQAYESELAGQAMTEL